VRAGRRLIVAAGCTALVATLAFPAVAAAHGIVGKQVLPVPTWLFAWAAALVLVVSFVGLALLWREPLLDKVRERELLSVPLVFEMLTGALGVFAFVVCVYAGFRGVQNVQANILPTVIFVHFWVGIPLLSLLFGDVFAAFSPWRAVGRAVGWVVARVGEPVAPLAYPQRLGRWPAAAGILFFAWVELVYTNRQDPSTLAIMALSYAAVQLVGMSLYGERQWTRYADPFAVYFSLFGRLAPLQWHGRRVALRTPGTAIAGLDTVAGTLALVLVSIGTTSFDGLTQGSFWTDIADNLISFFRDLGLGSDKPIEAAFTLGLVVMVALVSAFYRFGIVGMRSVDRERSVRDLARQFAPTLVPISLAYVVAHYFSLIAYSGQAIAYLASDPLGHGSDLLGTASATIDYGWISANAIWYVQVGALLVGHVTGLTLAHDKALKLYPDLQKATRSQYWMLTVMVGFTMLALWLISAAAAASS
jgi:hypothetical protein